MVRVLLEGLRADPQFEVHHVDARVSDDLEDVGSFRPRKFLRLLKSIAQAWGIRLRHGRMAFYYVPAPAKRSAIMRDWVVMALCRPLFPELILHWHAYGLGEWAAAGQDWTRRLTRFALGKADLSVVLNNYNRRDAAVFEPKRIEVVPNGIEDLFPDYDVTLDPKRKARAVTLALLGAVAGHESRVAGQASTNPETVRFLFLGHLMETKGVFVAIEAAGLANEELRKANAPWRAELILAGSYAAEGDKIRVEEAMAAVNRSRGDEGPCVSRAGFLDSGQKKSALERADCLLFPTFYENEAQPLVLLEAMSAGLPIITTSWRGVAEVLPPGYPAPAAPGSAPDCAERMLQIAGHCRSDDLRRQFTEYFTLQQHVASMLARLR